MNGTDALIAREMKRRESGIKALKKKKKEWGKIKKKLDVIDTANIKFQSIDDKDNDNWTQKELYTNIVMRGPKIKKLSKKNKPKLWEMWTSKYSKMPVID